MLMRKNPQDIMWGKNYRAVCMVFHLCREEKIFTPRAEKLLEKQSIN